MKIYPHLTRKCNMKEAFYPLIEFSIRESSREEANEYLEALFQYVFDYFDSIVTLEHAKKVTFDNLNIYAGHFDSETYYRVMDYYGC